MNSVAIIVNSALYLAGVFVAGIVMQDDLAWKFALVTAGLCYLCPMCSDLHARTGDRTFANAAVAFMILSIIFGTGAGAALLL